MDAGTDRHDIVRAAMYSRTTTCHTSVMKYDVDITSQEEAGDGLPDLRRRLRVLCAALLVSLGVWMAAVLLI